MNGQCKYKYDGKDTDGTKWYRCLTHNELAPSKDAPCSGYKESKAIQKKKIQKLILYGNKLQIDQAIFEYWNLKDRPRVAKPYNDD
jgi:hypothetical protein